jgi:hypothetical protein
MSTATKGAEDGSGAGGLVLDDYLVAIADIRRHFGLPIAAFGLRQIQAEPVVKTTIKALLDDVIARHGSKIYSKPHPFLSELGNDIYGELIATSAYSGHQIRSGCIKKTLRRAIEVGLQTIVQLPSRHAKPPSVPRRLKSAALAVRRAAERMEFVISANQIRHYIDLWDDPASQARLLRLPGEIRWGADALNAVAALKLTRIRMDSPNPQTSLTMYLIGWMEAAAGSPNYERLATLVQAAFCAAGKSTPKWTHRLAIEMHLKRKWRKKWAQTISS